MTIITISTFRTVCWQFLTNQRPLQSSQNWELSLNEEISSNFLSRTFIYLQASQICQGGSVWHYFITKSHLSKVALTGCHSSKPNATELPSPWGRAAWLCSYPGLLKEVGTGWKSLWKRGIVFVSLQAETIGGWMARIGSAMAARRGWEEGEVKKHILKRLAILLLQRNSIQLLNIMSTFPNIEVDGVL